MEKIFEWFENDRINRELNWFPKSYKSSEFDAKRFIVQDSYEEGIDFKIEWEKIICECKVPSEKSNDEKIDVVHKEKREMIFQNQKLMKKKRKETK
jgi:hypothetical protein